MKTFVIKLRKCICLVISALIISGAFPIIASAASQCPDISGSNAGANEYPWNYAAVNESHLVPTSDGGLMRFQNGAVSGKYLVEYYTSDYEIKSQQLVASELPIFGGFYSDGSSYYVLSGQENPSQSAAVECFRITKYDLNWKRIASASLKDCNTVIPFDAGSARFAHSGKYLIVRTCHEMYADSNGINHQANVTIQIDTTTMTITDELTDVAHVSAGYMSHSFNQFVKIESDHIVALDHGDAHLRALTLIKYPTFVSSGEFNNWGCEYIEAVSIPGESGENYTGIELGGFEISGSSYLMAYNSVTLDSQFMQRSTRNIYITAVDKNTDKVTTTAVTDFSEGESSAGCPHLVKINDNKFMVLWSENGDVAYVMLDGNGKATSEIYYIADAKLSDCAPVINSGYVVWFINDGANTTFYRINISEPAESKINSVISGHDITVTEYPSSDNNTCSVKCQKCAYSENIKVSDELEVYWNVSDGEGSYAYPLKQTDFKVNDSIYYMVDTHAAEGENSDLEIVFSDESAFNVSLFSDDSTWGYITLEKSGTYTISVRYKYNPALNQTITVNVAGTTAESGNYKLGDVNMNGEIDSRDYVFLKRAYFGTYKLSDAAKLLADITQNGEIDSRDYVFLKRAYFGTYKIG